MLFIEHMNMIIQLILWVPHHITAKEKKESFPDIYKCIILKGCKSFQCLFQHYIISVISTGIFKLEIRIE